MEYTSISIALGFVFASVGAYLLDKYVRKPLSDKMKDSKLKRFLLYKVN